MHTKEQPLHATLLYVNGCHAYHQAFDELAAALIKAGYSPRFDVLMVQTNDEAREHTFFGSPAVHINGVDVDPRAERVTDYKASSCRPYRWEGASYDYPPKDMIVAALQKI